MQRFTHLSEKSQVSNGLTFRQFRDEIAGMETPGKILSNSLSESYVFDGDGVPFGRFHTLAENSDTKVFQVLGIRWKADLGRAIFLPWTSCRVVEDVPARRIIVSQPKDAISQAERVAITLFFSSALAV